MDLTEESHSQAFLSQNHHNLNLSPTMRQAAQIGQMRDETLGISTTLQLPPHY